MMTQNVFNCDNYFHSYASFNVIDTENADARNPCSKISLLKLDLVLSFNYLLSPDLNGICKDVVTQVVKYTER